MKSNPEAMKLQEKGKMEYEWGTLWPHYHKEKMGWATGFRTRGDVDIFFLSGSTGRDPFTDGAVVTDKDALSVKGKVVGGIREQTRQALMDIKNNLEMMGASLRHIVMFRYYVTKREDFVAWKDETYGFYREFEPDLLENPRPSTYLTELGLGLPDMLVEIEAWAVVPRGNNK
jgi:enamine deaminase RidA (YjgF/YER057c/UK114 family)